MVDFLNEALNAVSGQEFDEKPVEIEEYVTSDSYLGLKPLSENQYKIIRAGSQIYKYETLVYLYGEEKANKRWKETFNEIVLQLGKASGKDYCSAIVVLYVVYLLLCLKDPSGYYGKPTDNMIDIVNIAVNADQAQNVFFANLVKMLKKCPWFEGKFYDRNKSIEFDKSIRIFSGHSQREAFEGLNLFLAVLDEISAFELESNTGNELANTAEATYDMYRASVNSRFEEFGKVFMLSFPRFKGDYIQQAYDRVVAEKEIITRKLTLKLDPELPDGFEGNEFDIEWEEDHIISYKYPKLFALKRPTWEMNPTWNIHAPANVRAFHSNPGDALGRFACMPSNLLEGFFKNTTAIENAFVIQNGVDPDGIFLEKFQPKDGTQYYIHVDLAQKHDRCAVAIGHVEKWVKIEMGSEKYSEVLPQVVIDAVRWWQPTKDKSVDFADVRAYIVALRRRGFDIKLCTFDRWQSHDTRNILEREHGITTDNLSVALKHYQDFLSVLYDNRLVGPNIPELIKELSELREEKNKVEHPARGYKDLSDAVCGAIFNAVAHTPKPVNAVVEVKTLKSVTREERKHQQELMEKQGVIVAPKRNMPNDIRSYLERIKVL